MGPTLAAQFGYLPGALWIIVGAVLAGAVQDFVVLFCSLRRDGKSLGQMAREEIGKTGGFAALITVLLIMVILLAVVALVIVNALKSSPWGAFTIAATMPIAIFMGLYLRYWRPGKVLECSAVGFVLIVASIFGGQAISESAAWSPWFTFSGMAIATALDRLRIHGQRAARLAAARAARLPEHVRETGRGAAARAGRAGGASDAAIAAADAFCRRHRPHFRGKNFPVLLHHHRLRRRSPVFTR